jgi:PAS domain S-box-containing protein
LNGGGEMGAQIRAFDWAATSLGAPEGWPQPLRSFVALMLASAQPVFLAWGPERTWFYNDAFTPILGAKHGRALGRPSREVWSEAWDDLEPLFALVFAGEPVHMEDFAVDLDRGDGLKTAHFAFSYTPAPDADGAIAGLFGSCIEITARVTAERRLVEQSGRLRDLELERSEAQFRLLVKSVTDYAIYMLDPNGRVSSWNLGAERIKGYRPEEIIGENFSRFYTPEDRASGLPQNGLAIARRDGRFETEGWRVRKDGSRFRAHVVIDAIPGEAGEILGFAKITRDVTERDAAQRQLEEAREALFQAQKLEAIGQLTGGIAHDFNNLLMAILGSLEMAQKRLPDDPQVNRLLANAVQGAKRGATLTQRMLAFARRQELKREAIDIPSLVYGMEDLLNRSLGPQFNLEIDFSPRLSPVFSDPAQVETALINLVVNARDAMPGGGTITLSAHQQAALRGDPDLPPGDYVCIRVGDEGEGMSPETLARATEPFFTTKGVGRGTGLGLAMIHGLALQSGGALRLSSRLGEGTNVELWLPATAARAVMTTLGAASEPGAPLAGAARPALTILAVDDDDLVLLNTAAMLEDLGHTVLQAASAAEALALMRQGQTIDLLITDHAMPNMTGAKLALAAGAERPGLPVVLATGFAELPTGEGAGLVRLAKPFTQAQLAEAIERAVRAPSLRRTTPPAR